MLLRLTDRQYLLHGQTLCLHMDGDPLPDMDSKDCQFVRVVHGFGPCTLLYPCERYGELKPEDANTTPPPALEPHRLGFIPVVQFNWEQVWANYGKYAVYLPNGRMLLRPTRHNVYAMNGGFVDVVPAVFEPMFYMATDRKFILGGKVIDDNSVIILQDFAEKSLYKVENLVFVPCP